MSAEDVERHGTDAAAAGMSLLGQPAVLPPAQHRRFAEPSPSLMQDHLLLDPVDTSMGNGFSAAPAAVTRRAALGGVLQVLAGCLAGAIPHSAVLHRRSMAGAHILMTGNGVLQAVVRRQG